MGRKSKQNYMLGSKRRQDKHRLHILCLTWKVNKQANGKDWNNFDHWSVCARSLWGFIVYSLNESLVRQWAWTSFYIAAGVNSSPKIKASYTEFVFDSLGYEMTFWGCRLVIVKVVRLGFVVALCKQINFFKHATDNQNLRALRGWEKVCTNRLGWHLIPVKSILLSVCDFKCLQAWWKMFNKVLSCMPWKITVFLEWAVPVHCTQTLQPWAKHPVTCKTYFLNAFSCKPDPFSDNRDVNSSLRLCSSHFSVLVNLLTPN